jgi:DNA polymerase-3 subunit epsilon
MKDFVAIDFETANFEQSSICSMGIVIVKDGELVDNFYSLVRCLKNSVSTSSNCTSLLRMGSWVRATLQ